MWDRHCNKSSVSTYIADKGCHTLDPWWRIVHNHNLITEIWRVPSSDGKIPAPRLVSHIFLFLETSPAEIKKEVRVERPIAFTYDRVWLWWNSKIAAVSTERLLTVSRFITKLVRHNSSIEIRTTTGRIAHGYRHIVCLWVHRDCHYTCYQYEQTVSGPSEIYKASIAARST